MFKFFVAVVAAFFISFSAYATEKINLSAENTLLMGDSFNWRSVSILQQQAIGMNATLAPGKPLYLVIDSGGGYISAGLELIDTLANFDRPVHTISLFAASMAFQTVQGLGKRYVVSNGTLMTHKAFGGFFGEFGGGSSQIDSRLDFWKSRINRLDQQTVDRTNGVHTLESYRALYNDEYWCDGQDCVEQGFVDSVAQVQCFGSLLGTKKEQRKFFFMGRRVIVSLTKSQCPLNTGIQDFSVSVNGKVLFSKNDRPRWDWKERKYIDKDVSQELIDFVNTIVTKKSRAERVVYLQVEAKEPSKPAHTPTPAVEPTLDEATKETPAEVTK
jgi:ATP-dependent protease ClpP protease subunit